MVETKWRAVGIGFAVIFLVNMLGAAVQQLAFLAGLVAALVGGAAAGYYAYSGRWDGAWNGFLAGSIGALVVTAVFAVLGLAVSIVSLSLGGIFATIGLGLAALVLIVLGAIPATVGGFVGGAISQERAMDAETGRPTA